MKNISLMKKNKMMICGLKQRLKINFNYILNLNLIFFE